MENSEGTESNKVINFQHCHNYQGHDQQQPQLKETTIDFTDYIKN